MLYFLVRLTELQIEPTKDKSTETEILVKHPIKL